MVYGAENFSSVNYLELESKLKDIHSKQGVLGKFWNNVKEFTTFGKSEKDCEKMLEKYKSGYISFEEAVGYIEDFEKKQENTVDLLTNIATGIGAIAYVTATAGTGPIGWTTALLGAPVGALIKSGANLLDRATNEVQRDALDVKEIAHDVVSGAVTGMTSAVSSGIFKGRASGQINFATSVKNGIKCGLSCGAISGSSSYLTDVVLDEDKEFNTADLLNSTASNALISGAVGGVIGGAACNNVIHSGIFSKVNRNNLAQAFGEDSFLSSSRKVLSNKVKNVTENLKTNFA